MRHARCPFRARLLGWLFALMAVFGQVTGVAALPPAALDAAGLPALGVICSSDHPAAPSEPPTHRHHSMDCTVCQLCASAAAQAAIVSPFASIPPRQAVAGQAAAILPPVRAPPGAPYRPGRPRGPPSLS